MRFGNLQTARDLDLQVYQDKEHLLCSYWTTSAVRAVHWTFFCHKRDGLTQCSMQHVRNESECPVDNCKFLSKMQEMTVAFDKKRTCTFPVALSGWRRGASHAHGGPCSGCGYDIVFE